LDCADDDDKLVEMIAICIGTAKEEVTEVIPDGHNLGSNG
jgi:hypothetical protein